MEQTAEGFSTILQADTPIEMHTGGASVDAEPEQPAVEAPDQVDGAWQTAAMYLAGELNKIAAGEGGRFLSARKSQHIARVAIVEFVQAIQNL